MVVVSVVSPIALRDDVLDVADADAVACGGRPVDLDVQVLAAGHLLRIDVAGARHLSDDLGDLPRQALEHPEIGAEQLDADLRADAGRQHVDAVDDRHRPDGRDSRELDRAAHLGAQRVQRQPRAPLRARLQPHDRLGHVQRRRVGGRLGAGDLGNDIGHLRHPEERGVLRLRDPGVLVERDARIRDRHEHQVALVQGRHELAADAAGQEQRGGEEEPGSAQRRDAMRESRVEDRAIEASKAAHHGVGLFRVEAPAKEVRAQDGHEGDGDHRGGENGEGLREGQRVKELPLLAGQREDRHERQHDDRHREEHRPADEMTGLAHRFENGRTVTRVDPLTLDLAEGVLGDDDAGVDEHADGDGDAGQAHDVRREPGVVHAEERGEHGERQRQRDDQDRTQVHQEQDVRQRHQQDLLDQRTPERPDRLLDQGGPVVERGDRDAGRQARPDLLDARLDGIDDCLGVDAGPGDDDAAHRLPGAADERRHPERVADLHVRHLLDVDGDTVRRANHDVLHVLGRSDEPDAADDEPRAVRLQDVAADVDVARAHGGDDVAERNAVAPEPVGIDVDLVLLDVAADRGHLRHARHRVELIADEPVLQAAQFAERMRRAVERVPEDVADPGRVRSEGGHHARRQGPADEAEPFEDPRPREVEIDLVLEDDVDHREAERRLRAHGTDAGESLEIGRQRIRDLILDLLRAVARPVGEDDHLVVGEVGNRVDGRGPQRPPAPPGQGKREEDDESPVTQRAIDQVRDHLKTPSCRGRALTRARARPGAIRAYTRRLSFS